MITLEFDILLICPMTIQLMSILILNLVIDAGAETAADELDSLLSNSIKLYKFEIQNVKGNT